MPTTHTSAMAAFPPQTPQRLKQPRLALGRKSEDARQRVLPLNQLLIKNQCRVCIESQFPRNGNWPREHCLAPPGLLTSCPLPTAKLGLSLLHSSGSQPRPWRLHPHPAGLRRLAI